MGALLGRLEMSTLGEVSSQAFTGVAVEIDVSVLKPADVSYPFIVAITCDQDCYVRQGKAGLAAASASNAWPLWSKGERQVIVRSPGTSISVVRVSTNGTLWYMVQNNPNPNNA